MTGPVPSAAPLDLTNPNAQVLAAAAENDAAVSYTGSITVGKNTYRVVKKLSALDMTILQDAQESGLFRQIIEAVPRLVVREQRDEFRDYLLSDPEDDDDKVTLDDVLEALTKGLEQVGARPTDR